MDFKLVSKNNMGAVVALILVVLLSQSKFFKFCFDSYLGRMILLIFIIFVAYTNKILGLFVVLCIILAFNFNSMNVVQSYNYYEGFDVSGNITDASGNSTATSIFKDKIAIDKAKENRLKNKLNILQQKENNSQTAATTSSAAASTTGTESFRGREGFNLQDIEGTMLRGKSSNAVPIFNDSRHQDNDVSPSDKSVFTSAYASF
jgi:hypothetical protein